MMMKFTKILLVITTLIMLNTSSAAAAVEVLHGNASRIMSGAEVINSVKEKIYNEAMRQISEKAGVYITSNSQTLNGKLTDDEIETITAAIINVTSTQYSKQFTDEVLKVSVAIDAELDVDRANEILDELARAHNSSKSIDQALTEYLKSQGLYDELQAKFAKIKARQTYLKVRDGIKLQADGKLNEALAHYNEALTENPNLLPVYIKRGHIYFIQGDSKAAVADYEKALAIGGNNDGLHYVKAVLAERSGKIAEAVKEYRIFVKAADIVYYDVEIEDALDKICDLDPDGVD